MKESLTSLIGFRGQPIPIPSCILYKTIRTVICRLIECNAVYSFSNLYSLGSGEKPYPCRFCGRRFRTNYNKLGHEKKCPDRHNVHTGAAILAPSPVQPSPDSPSVVPNVVYR